MKQFFCQCGQSIFFDSNSCVACGLRLGFDPGSQTMLSLREKNGRWQAEDGRLFRLCDNTVQYGVCNWLVPEEQEHPLCWGCQFNRTVPNQAKPDNALRWKRLEAGKKRLLYTLMQLQLPLVNGWADPDAGLLFDFVEDERSNSACGESFVTTGYLDGVITVNALEADDAAREAQRLQMKENYRTVLGHLRHESGHFYWQHLARNTVFLNAFRQLFGDEREDYPGALKRYYENGPNPTWQAHYVSGYASVHPAEDWAESWGHYLHLCDAMETAEAYGLIADRAASLPIAERIARWRQMSIALNELNRSVGMADAYPFTLNATVVEKLAFVDRFIAPLQTPR